MPVYAGSLNYAGTLTLQVTAAGGGTLIDEIERAAGKGGRAPSRARMRLADRAARVYAPVVHLAAALTVARLARWPARRCTTRWSPPSPC